MSTWQTLWEGIWLGLAIGLAAAILIGLVWAFAASSRGPPGGLRHGS